MITVQPRLLLRTQQLNLHQSRLHWALSRQYISSGGSHLVATDHRDMLQPEVPFVPEVFPRLSHLDHVDVLDPNTEFAIGIVTRFVRHHHTRLKSNVVVGGSRAYTVRTFMDIEEGADSMGCTMSEGCQVGPKAGSSRHVPVV